MTAQHDAATPVLTDVDERGVVTVTLNRPERNNAYNAELLRGLHDAMDALPSLPQARVVVVRGNGRYFQAGADLDWIRSLTTQGDEVLQANSRLTADAVERFNHLDLPTVAVVQGGCFGGGTGLLAACDVVVAADNAKFAITEVRWGLTASIIIPQLNDAIGVRQCRRYALTGERFDAAEARRIGLVHDTAPEGELDELAERVVADLLASSPSAIAATKRHIRAASWSADDEARYDEQLTSHWFGRRTPDGIEGLAAFEAKRTPQWLSLAESNEQLESRRP